MQLYGEGGVYGNSGVTEENLKGVVLQSCVSYDVLLTPLRGREWGGRCESAFSTHETCCVLKCIHKNTEILLGHGNG